MGLAEAHRLVPEDLFRLWAVAEHGRVSESIEALLLDGLGLFRHRCGAVRLLKPSLVERLAGSREHETRL